MPSPKTNRRKRLRRARSHPAWITFVGKVGGYECRVLNASKDGARLLAEIVAPIGARFYLSAASNALDRKECEVTWQKDRMVGIRFV
jgi:hypothetical protein